MEKRKAILMMEIANNRKVENKRGYFHEFGTKVANIEGVPSLVSIAIFEDKDGQIHCPVPELIKFEDWKDEHFTTS